MILPLHPGALEAQRLHPPEAREQHHPNRTQPRRMLTPRLHLSQHLAEMAKLLRAQPMREARRNRGTRFSRFPPLP